MLDPVLQTVPLGMQWPTVDPFLFCVHHLDRYPAGDERLAPRGSLAGRNLGADFDGIDGWRMYHGLVVPGFPQHPHRGFETVTHVRRGLVDHSDSMGATARYGPGDTQWLTAGRGIVHAEMFPLVHPDEPNPLELFQIWLNLPASHKMADPSFSMLWDEDLPRHVASGGPGSPTEVTVIAGTFGDVTPLAAPPDSWASQARADVAIWHLRLDEGAEVSLPPAAGPDTIRVVYAYEGASLLIGNHPVVPPTAAVVDATAPVTMLASAGAASCLVLQGRPIGEPVVSHGPFVMNTSDEIAQAFADYRRTQFGGWPWPADDPVHPQAATRFAKHPGGAIARPVRAADARGVLRP